ncbi:uncharacterized protein LOC124140152 isoform X2 [Haliotis rufescens]|uniref:uncharacterized protein LOC124140152 isoform X2 n=1 Tax=Haliotis rufescens TaxID=6454 RepID=UPI001EB07826|nr:uncharacterized protein LOC124140152 isoform X2 [Haliotis rufescens]
MASLWNNAHYWSVSLLLFAYVYMCLGCSPPEGNYTEPTIEEKMYYSDSFVYGKVIKIYKGGYMYDTLYTAEVEVHCTFKGSPLPQRINISEAGYEPGLCVSNNFSVGGEYFIFLDRVGDKLRPSYNEVLLSADAPEIDDIQIYCEHEINYPIGVNEAEAVKACPEPYPDYPNCIKYVEPVVATPMPPKDTDSAGLSVEDGKSETGEVVSIDKENSGSRVLLSVGATVLCVLISIL